MTLRRGAPKEGGNYGKSAGGECINGSPINPRQIAEIQNTAADEARDVAYAVRYWEKAGDLGPERKKVMMNVLLSAYKAGFLYMFVSETGISEDDRMKLSAYRVLARQLGYDVGKFRFNKSAWTVCAPISRRAR